MSEGVANVLKAIVEEKVGKKAVDDGECFALVDMALKSAGAKSAEDFGKVTLHSDYVWGHAVDLDRIRPGDVLQFRNHVVKIRTETDTSWQERTYTRPHHTAVVVAVEGDGSVIVVEQKVKPDPKKVTRNVIARLAQGRETRSGTLEQNGVQHDAKDHYYRQRCRQGVSAGTEIEGGVAFPAESRPYRCHKADTRTLYPTRGRTEAATGANRHSLGKSESVRPQFSYQILALPEQLPVYTKKLLLAKAWGADLK